MAEAVFRGESIKTFVSAKAKQEELQVLPEGTDTTLENCKREMLKLRIEN